MALKCTNTSALPSSGVMKPKPFSELNHFTVPVATADSPFLSPSGPPCRPSRRPRDPPVEGTARSEPRSLPSVLTVADAGSGGRILPRKGRGRPCPSGRGMDLRRRRDLHDVGGLLPARESVDLVPGSDLLLDQERGQPVEHVAMSAEDRSRALVGLLQERLDLLVDHGLGGLRVVARSDLLLAEVGRAAAGEPDRPESGAHPELPDHADRELRRALEVVRGTAGDLSEHELLSGAAAHPHREGVAEVALRIEVALGDRELLGESEGLAGGEDR